jgi:hypothetical protein
VVWPPPITQQLEQPEMQTLSFEERFSLLPESLLTITGETLTIYESIDTDT